MNEQEYEARTNSNSKRIAVVTSADTLNDATVCFDTAGLSRTHVDFIPFLRPRAKIDVIKFACQESDLEAKSLAQIDKSITDGRVEVPGRRSFEQVNARPWLAVHDPSLADLQFIVERFWSSRVMYIEVAIDLRLPEEANNLEYLDILKEQVRHCLFPQRHVRLKDAVRKRYCEPRRRFLADGMGTPLPDTQVLWEAPNQCDRVGLYIKTLDNRKPVATPHVRIEARLEATGPGVAGLHRVGMLPHWAKSLRKYLSKMFWIADGFKDPSALAGRGVPRNVWDKWGAQAALGRDAALVPNAEANRLVGEALKELGASLSRLQPPSVVRNRYDEWIDSVTP